MFSRALLEKRGNIALRRAKGPLPLPRPSLALKLPLVLYAGGGRRICKCVLCVQRQHSGKETKYEGGREGEWQGDCDHRGDKLCGLGRGERGGHGQSVRTRGQGVAF